MIKYSFCDNLSSFITKIKGNIIMEETIENSIEEHMEKNIEKKI